MAELAGGFAVPDAGPLAGQIEQSFLRRLQSMPAEAQRLLLAAAAEPVGDVALLPSPVGRARPWTDHRLAVEGMALIWIKTDSINTA
jgi:hypothetical protein